MDAHAFEESAKATIAPCDQPAIDVDPDLLVTEDRRNGIVRAFRVLFPAHP